MIATVEFARIDCHDDVRTRFCPVAFCEDVAVELGPNNGKLAVAMNREYLVRLKQLQNEIAEKYISRFDQKEKPVAAGHEWDLGMDEEQYNEAVEEAMKNFPGEEALIYQ